MAQNEDSSASEKLTYLLIGAGLGATVALLFAPKAGRELRTDIADYTKRGVDVAGESARALTDRANELYETGREKVNDVYGTARERVSQSAGTVSEVAGRQKEQIAAAIEAGKQAYREEKRKAGEPGGATVEGEEA
jgi:gas vesicle protein